MSRWGTVMTFACQHQAHCDFDRPQTKERLRKLAAGPCPRCRGQQAMSLEGAPEPEARDLPDLVGTEKQVLWARDIRRKQLLACEQHLTEWRRLIEAHERSGKTEKVAAAREKLRASLDALGALERETSAHQWIENREMDARQLLGTVRVRGGE